MTIAERRANVHLRSEAIRTYVRKRAQGVRDGCEKEAPFVKRQRHPYLVAHHVNCVSDAGPDHPEWVTALCPNCHCRVHYGRNGEAYNPQLIGHLGEIELSEGL